MAEGFRLRAVAVPRSVQNRKEYSDDDEEFAEQAVQKLLDTISEQKGRVVGSTVVSVYHNSAIPTFSTTTHVLIVEEPVETG